MQTAVSLSASTEREGMDPAADLQSRGTEQTERTRRQRGRQAGGEQKENELFCPEAIQKLRREQAGACPV